MRFIKLNRNTATGLTPRNAVRQMIQATMRATNINGALHVSLADAAGNYWVAFENHGHASAFLDILGQLGVRRLDQSTETPQGYRFGRVNIATDSVEFPGGSSV